MEDHKDTYRKIEVLKKEREAINRTIDQNRFVWWIAISWLIGGGLLGYVFTQLRGEASQDTIISYAILGGVIAIFAYSYYSYMLRLQNHARLRRNDMKIAQLGGIELQETIEENFFTKLVQINFKYLDQYYLQTQEQAEKSFRLSTFASISGFVLNNSRNFNALFQRSRS